MAIPTPSRVWQFRVNQAGTGTGLNTCQTIFREFKNALKGLGTFTNSAGATITPTGLWTVVGSGNSVSFGMDGVDRWVTNADLVWSQASSVKSWIVLKNTAFASNFQLMIHLETGGTTSGTTGNFFVSPAAGFTGGGTSARPTATDEIQIIAGGGGQLVGTPNAVGDTRFHILTSADGHATRMLLCRNGFTIGFWHFEKLEDPVAGWNTPYVFRVFGDGTAVPAQTSINYSSYFTTAGLVGIGNASARITMLLTCEGIRPSTSNLGQRITSANDLSGAFPLLPMGLFSEFPANGGRLASFPDWWWTITSIADSTTYPNDGSRQLIQFGNTVMPWNGTIPFFL